jgi:hypothetical protein
MRAMACAAAALMVALTMSCRDRDADDTASRVDTAVEETGNEARDAANDAGNAADEAAEDTKDAAEDAKDDLADASYSNREEFRHDVKERLDAIDRELKQFESELGADATEARVQAVTAARQARSEAERSAERLAGATAANWDELKSKVNAAIDSADRQLRALRPDAKPMGGTG